MANLFRTDLPLHAKYDLKGSTLGRAAPPGADPVSFGCWFFFVFGGGEGG